MERRDQTDFNYTIEELLLAAVEYDAGDAMRIQHLLKVHEFSRLIGRMEGLDERTQFVLETAAILHDIGIHKAEEKYGSSQGTYQELEGPEIARTLLSRLGCPQDIAERAAYLVGHHHTYSNMDGLDYQILVEADFLVNLYEDEVPQDARRSAYAGIFRTESGKRLCRLLYPECGEKENEQKA